MTDPLGEVVDVSLVVPLLDERATLEELYRQVCAALTPTGRRWELLFVDDGSRDGSAEALEALAADAPQVGVIRLRRNFGKAAALDAGFARARGALVATLDADLQDDPGELPRALAALEEGGLDAVSGWKRRRLDPLSKRLPSRLFNLAVSLASGLRLHDHNCGLKVYRREALDGLRLYGELHRFIPVLLHGQGYRVGELPVDHRPRLHGRSKYGAGRLVRGLLDLLTVVLVTRYLGRPLHLFGGLGLLLGLAGLAVCAYLTGLWLQGEGIGSRPLLALGVLLVSVGVQLVGTGLVAELVVRAQHAERPGYAVRSFTPPRATGPQVPGPLQEPQAAGQPLRSA